MTDRPTVDETSQIGVETVLGTGVPALIKLASTSITMGPKSPVKLVKPLGSRAAQGALKLKEWSEGSIEGDADYNDLLYLIAMQYGAPTTTIPAGATNARKHAWIPKTFRPNRPKSLTVENGNWLSGGERAPGVVSNGLSLTFNLEGVAVGGDVFGKLMTAGVQLSTNEQQTITLVADGGTFTISYGGQTTTALAWNAAASVVEDALEALSTIGVGNIHVTKVGLVYTLEFRGELGQANVAPATTGVGNTNEQQTVTVDATSGTFTIAYEGEDSAALAFDVSAANMETALLGLAALTGNVSVSKVGSVYTITFIGDLAGTDAALLTTDVTSLVKAGGTATAAVATTVPGVAPTLLTGASPGTATVATSVPGVAPTELACVPISPVKVEVYMADSLADLDDENVRELLLDLDEAVWGKSDSMTRRFTLNRAEPSYRTAVEKAFTFGCSIDVGKDEQAAAILANLRATDTKWLRISCLEDREVESGQPYSLDITIPCKFIEVSDGDKDDLQVSNFPFEPIHDSGLGGCMMIELVNGLASL